MALDQWRVLNARSELLRIALTNRRVVGRYAMSLRGHGFDMVRTALAESVVVGAVRLLKSRDIREACLENLISPLGHTSDATYLALKEDFSKPQPFFHSTRRSKRLSSEILSEIEKHHQTIEKGRLEKQFDGIARSVFNRYSRLVTHSITKNLISIRDKVIAHAEMRFESGSRRLSVAGDYPICIADIFATIETLGRIAVKCQLVFNNTGSVFAEYKKIHRKEAVDFWL